MNYVQTKLVTEKATGKRIKIKASRFNSELHETTGEPPVMTVRNIETPYDTFTRNQLMTECAEKGIKTLVTYKKADLLRKLIEHDKSLASVEEAKEEVVEEIKEEVKEETITE